MRIGVAYGTSKTPTVGTIAQTLAAITDLYKMGLRAFVLPEELFTVISDASDLYKERYGELLKVRNLAQKYNIELSLHLKSLPEDPVQADSLLKTFCSLSNILDCRCFITHPNFYKMVPQGQALKLVVYKINEIVGGVNFKVNVGIETTGRINEVGSLEDVIDISRRTRSTEPIINFGHVHARGSGALRTDQDFRAILDRTRAEIGQSWLNNAYLIFSGVSYGPSGETRHIPFAKSDLKLEYLTKAIMSLGMKGTLILDDPGREKAVLEMQQALADMVR